MVTNQDSYVILKREAVRKISVEIFLKGIGLGITIGVILGYAWRMGQVGR